MVENPDIRCPDVVNVVQKPIVLRVGVVDLNGYAMGNDYLHDRSLRIRHGIQRLASPSTRVEHIEKDELSLRSRPLESCLVIGFPVNTRHRKASITFLLADAVIFERLPKFLGTLGPTP
jgi:hypothetical protein